MKFTQRSIEQAQLPEGKTSVIFWEDTTPGFGLRVQNEKRTWVVRCRLRGTSKQVQTTIGPVEAIPIKQARIMAGEYLAAAKQGRDLAKERKDEAKQAEEDAKAATEGRIVERYLEATKGTIKPATFNMYRAALMNQWGPMHDRMAMEIERRDCMRHLEGLSAKHGPASAE